MKVLVVKDEEGILRPQYGIWEGEAGSYSKAVREDWIERLSKKKQYQGCQLVEANLTEI